MLDTVHQTFPVTKTIIFEDPPQFILPQSIHRALMNGNKFPEADQNFPVPSDDDRESNASEPSIGDIDNEESDPSVDL